MSGAFPNVLCKYKRMNSYVQHHPGPAVKNVTVPEELSMPVLPTPPRRYTRVLDLHFRSASKKTAAHVLTALSLIVFSAGSGVAAGTITFYRDGTLYRQEAGAVKGIIDIPLAAGLLEHTLAIVPAAGTTIHSVETRKSGANGSDNEIEALTEQRRRLEDRLQALETREAIFTSAAKTQSGKAPRKTKANPDPMQAIRQGTDFAIAQLEAVYTSRRKTMQEIRNMDARLGAAKKGSRPSEHSVRIAVTPPRGSVTLRYATSERGWQPQYNLHANGESTVMLQLSARITGNGRGYQVRVSPGALAEGGGAETFPALAGSTILASYRLPFIEERSIEGIFNTFSGTVTNSSTRYLPPGDSGLYRGGTYLGSFRFEGLSSGRSRTVSLAK